MSETNMKLKVGKIYEKKGLNRVVYREIVGIDDSDVYVKEPEDHYTGVFSLSKGYFTKVYTFSVIRNTPLGRLLND